MIDGPINLRVVNKERETHHLKLFKLKIIKSNDYVE